MKKLFCLVIVLLLGAPQSSLAVGSFSLTTSDLLTTTSLTTASSVAKLSGLTFNTISVGTVTLAMELEELGTSLQSPHHNVVVMTALDQFGAVIGNGGMATSQQTAGGANVTLAVNSIIVGGMGVVSSAVPTLSLGGNQDPTMLLALQNNPAFAILNSFPVAQALILREAFSANAAAAVLNSTGNAMAIDVVNVGVSEFSPHHNVGAGQTAANSLSVLSNVGFVTAQQQAGFANVQAAVNQLIVGSAVFASVNSIGIQ